MKKYYNAAFIYMILGLIMGVFYREFTRLSDFEGVTMLKGLHTHILVLGFLFFVIVLLLEKNFAFSHLKGAKAWFITYHVAFISVIGTMLARGIMQVKGIDFVGLSHMAGLAHTLMGVALVWFMILLGKAVNQR